MGNRAASGPSGDRLKRHGFNRRDVIEAVTVVLDHHEWDIMAAAMSAGGPLLARKLIAEAPEGARLPCQAAQAVIGCFFTYREWWEFTRLVSWVVRSRPARRTRRVTEEEIGLLLRMFEADRFEDRRNADIPDGLSMFPAEWWGAETVKEYMHRLRKAAKFAETYGYRSFVEYARRAERVGMGPTVFFFDGLIPVDVIEFSENVTR